MSRKAPTDLERVRNIMARAETNDLLTIRDWANLLILKDTGIGPPAAKRSHRKKPDKQTELGLEAGT